MDADVATTAPRLLPRVCGAYNYGNSKTGCIREDCQFLHLCRRFLLGKCTDECSREHSLEGVRNTSLLERNGPLSADDRAKLLADLCRQECRKAFGVCMQYNYGLCSSTACPRLHVCYRHVLDGCPLENCDLSHDVKSAGHNAAVLTNAGWSDRPVSELLRHLHEQVLCSPPHPSVCRLVNSRPLGCQGHCLRFHCCETFTRGNCRYAGTCFRSHSLQDDPHNLRVLRFFGWGAGEALDRMVAKREEAPRRPSKVVVVNVPRDGGSCGGDGDGGGDGFTGGSAGDERGHGNGKVEGNGGGNGYGDATGNGAGNGDADGYDSDGSADIPCGDGIIDDDVRDLFAE